MTRYVKSLIMATKKILSGGRELRKKESYYIGVDIGSVSINTVVLSETKEVIEEYYTRSKGQPLEKTKDILTDILNRYPIERIRGISTTGSGGRLLAKLLGGKFTNEVISQAKAVELFYPDARTIIEMGGEDSKLIFIRRHGASGSIKIEDFSMNAVCAAGTGSFLDQQASRLGFTIEEFGRIAMKSERPPRIAGRCSVFAKSDMIHLQQVATPDYDIVAGLCFAVARNFKSTMGKGKQFLPPVSFQGGVAANAGVRRAFKEVLELEDDQFTVPKHYASMGAIGSALIAVEKDNACWSGRTDSLEEYISKGANRDKYDGLKPLKAPEKHPCYDKSMPGPSYAGERLKVFLGVDIGSVSTNLVLIDKDNRLITKRYLMTAGRPIEAVRQGLEEIGKEMGDRIEVVGVGTTGSGRYLIGDLVGGDIVRNEITAQAKAAAHIDPQVDTIFEIGGQDSKYISLKDGVVVDFEMNKVCAAGTGSFLEEQAERLGISIKGDFGDLALSCKKPAPMGERCTVFIESDLVHHQQSGAARNELVAGLSYSIVHNYLNRVVRDRRIGDRVFFQGGTAANLGVVAAFENVLGKPVTVPENHDVTGAIGVAMLTMEEKEPKLSTSFKGFDLSKKKYDLDSFECKDCSNLCEIRKVTVEGEAPLYYGSRCEKYDVKGKGGKKNNLPDLFKERNKILLTSYKAASPLPEDATEIGLPRILYNYELYPFFNAFFTELGFKVVLSRPSNKEIIRNGVERVISEVCFPIKIANGHIEELVNKGIKRIFLPSIIDLQTGKSTSKTAYHCPYVQGIPYLVPSSFDFDSKGVEILSPVIFFNQKEKDLLKTFVEFGKTIGKKKTEVRMAFETAVKTQKEFKDRLIDMGKDAIAGLKDGEKAMVIVGRPYNTCDPGINLSLPQKLKELGVTAFPFDLLLVDDMIDEEISEEMYWKSGQRILALSKMLRDNPNLYAVYITNFGCGPDSFITHFFKDLSGGKPFLQIEIDEHSADAGVITRCEAFLDSLKNSKAKGDKLPERKRRDVQNQLKKRLYLPYMSDGVYGLKAGFEACGVEADVIPEPDKESLRWGRKYTCGRECYPCILTTGDMVKLLKSPDFDPKCSAFFMPSADGPCRFG
ncbi:MAG: acyl-CoA dehydratase activase, partial [Thermodesulfobacteriota bacterium]